MSEKSEAPCTVCGVPVTLDEESHEVLLRGERPLVCLLCARAGAVWRQLVDEHGRMHAEEINTAIRAHERFLAMVEVMAGKPCPSCGVVRDLDTDGDRG